MKVCRLEYLGALGTCRNKAGSSCRVCSWYIEEDEARKIKKIRDAEAETRKNFLSRLRRNRRG